MAYMKLEMNIPVKSLIEKGLVSSVSAVMSEGELLVCRAIEKQGDSVLLRNRDGSLFAASMQEGVNIGIGDDIELTVNHMEKGRTVLKVLDIVPGGKTVEMPVKEGNIEGNRTRQEASNSAQALSNALGILKQNSNILPKLAVFLAANQIAALPDNIDVLTQVITGDAKIGSVLSDMLADINDRSVGAETKAAAVTGGDTQTSPQDDTAVMKHRTSDTAFNMRIKDSEKPLADPDDFIQPQEADKTDSDVIKDKIEQRIKDIFTNLEKENDGTAFRSKVLDIPAKLKELKLLIEHHDIKDKETYLQKTEQLQQQIKVLSQIKRAAYFQIPIYLKGQTNTAELFVYRYRRRKQNGSKDNIVIALGLDTEHIGRVEAFVRVSDKELALQFAFEKSVLIEAAHNHKQRLMQALSGIGYRLTDIKANKLEEKTTILNAEQTLTRMAGDTHENVDVKI